MWRRWVGPISGRGFASLTTGPVRVRYAPSPTGDLHLGGLRTALFNYLLAKKQGGQFLLRIEDTDKEREVPGSAEGLIHSLHWAGLYYDEGPILRQGPTGPVIDKEKSAEFVQSLHLHAFRDAAEQLLQSGHAYRCFCTTERLNHLREAQAQRGLPTMYDRACLSLSKDEIATKLASNTPYTIRLKVPHGSTTLNDLVVGSVKFSHDVVDDQVLMKSDGFPTYHLACVVDDHNMRISHVIRGQEWLSSTPKHVLLYKAFKWEPPQFAHLPLLLNPDKTKLSKRKGDVAVKAFQGQGYLPEGLLNFVALLGWNPKDTNEFFTLKGLEAAFAMEGVNKSNSVVDRARLNWLNSLHIKHALSGSAESQAAFIHEFVLPVLRRTLGNDVVAGLSDGFIRSAIGVHHTRVETLNDFGPALASLLHPPELSSPDVHGLLTKDCGDVTGNLLQQVRSGWSMLPSTSDGKAAFNVIKDVATASNVPPKKLMAAVRVALTGMTSGASLSDMIGLISVEKCADRLQAAVQSLR